MLPHTVVVRSGCGRHGMQSALGASPLARNLFVGSRSPRRILNRSKLSKPNTLPLNGYGRRTIFAGVSPFVLVPGVFVGLLLGHWLHKCLLMVLFQNKIIYMPSLPPGSRREKLANYSTGWGPVHWEEKKMKSLDGTKLSLAVGQLSGVVGSPRSGPTCRKQRILIYFQGNGASLPPRTSMLSNILTHVASTSEDEWVLIGLSYRGYWTSSGRAHQRGIEKDAEALLDWVVETYAASTKDVDLLLWGQSIGSGVAAFAAAKYIEKQKQNPLMPRPRISHLVLETPFLSIKSMLAALYPDWWVPYRHLWPFLRSWWDSEEALRKIALAEQPPKVLMVVASRDELVPRVQADQLEKLCQDLRLDIKRNDVLGALHVQASTLEPGKNAIVRFLRDRV